MELITPADAAGRVTAALRSAAEATGAGFDYLLRTAKRESSLDPAAQAPTSSARGLFQFIDQTWLEVLKEEGPTLGLGAAAADVSKSASGRYAVADPARRAELLAMRDDPQAAALLAGAFTRRNAATFANGVGRAPTEGELYAAHFLGAQGSVELTKLAAATPQASAADAFPAQASANRAIFFDKGRPRSAVEVYASLTATPSAVAPTPSAPSAPRTALALQSASDGSERPRFNGGVEDDGAAFHSLFKTGRRSPVSAYVQQAWSAFGAAGMASDVPAGQARKSAAATVSETVAPAYAPQAAAVPVRASDRTAAAVDAVNSAAKPRRRAATAASPQTIAAVPAKAEIPAAAATTVQTTRFDLGSYLLSILSGSAQPQGGKGARP